jgi:hypothetical protein
MPILILIKGKGGRNIVSITGPRPGLKTMTVMYRKIARFVSTKTCDILPHPCSAVGIPWLYLSGSRSAQKVHLGYADA